jgi:hypothetical protein
MTSSYTVWMIGGKEPIWGEIRVRHASQVSADCWKVVVEGNGADLVKHLKSRSDLFFFYLRL